MIIDFFVTYKDESFKNLKVYIVFRNFITFKENAVVNTLKSLTSIESIIVMKLLTTVILSSVCRTPSKDMLTRIFLIQFSRNTIFKDHTTILNIKWVTTIKLLITEKLSSR